MNYKQKSLAFALNTAQSGYGLTGNGIMKNFFSHNFNAFEKNGETISLYKKENIPNIVLRLMDNRSFLKASKEERASMIYSDYYPQEAKTQFAVYLDDRRNLCQELHNKLCSALGIPATRVAFVMFGENNIDDDLLHYYCVDDGVLYMNANIDYSGCEPTELAEQVIRGTFMHEMHYGSIKNFTSLDKLDGTQKYLALSLVMNNFLANNYLEERKSQPHQDLVFNDYYSPTKIISIVNSYNFLDAMFKRFNLTNMKAVQPFYSAREGFFSSFQPHEDADEEISDIDEEMLLNEENELEVSADAENYTTGEEMLSSDFSTLHEIGRTKLDKATGGFFKEFFDSELSECAHDFYSKFIEGFDENSFMEQFNEYEEDIVEYDKLNDEIDSALNEENEK